MILKPQYDQAKRFDEGNIYQSQDYITCVKMRRQIEDTAEAIYGVGVRLLFREYADICSDLTELECQHFFKEGYLAAKSGK